MSGPGSSGPRFSGPGSLGPRLSDGPRLSRFRLSGARLSGPKLNGPQLSQPRVSQPGLIWGDEKPGLSGPWDRWARVECALIE